MPQEKFSSVSFYIVAHADDWQLFMQPKVFHDLVDPDNKVVFIITTAGDAGSDKTYWLSREEGLKSSVRFCVCSGVKAKESVDTASFLNYHVNCWTLNNSTSYFLRLPDGNINGKGFSANQFHSLSKLKTGEIYNIKAVNNSATYQNWDAFCATVESIIKFESEDISEVCINYLNPDEAANPNDHADHISTGHAVKDLQISSDVRQCLFVGYSVNTNQSILPPQDLFWKVGMFAAYEKAVYDLSGYSTLKEDIQIYSKWCLSSPSFITIEG